MNTYRRGRIAEKKVANWLEDKGFTNIRRSAGSRGPADIYARSPSGVKTYVQVKAYSASLDSQGKRELRSLAKDRGGAAMDVHYDGPGKIKPRFWGNWSKRK
jgi:Holliday junction resolvase-like predicted endonuclease